MEVNIASDVLAFIARQGGQQNIRELEGLLNRVTAFAKLFNSAPTLELAVHAMENISGRESAPESSLPNQVINAVAQSFNMKAEDLKGSKRDKETSLARRVAMFILRQETGSSLAQIGALLGGRDPSSVTNACKKFSAELAQDRSLKHRLAEIQKTIQDSGKK